MIVMDKVVRSSAGLFVEGAGLQREIYCLMIYLTQKKKADLPVEAPVVGRLSSLWGLGRLGVEGVQELLAVSQSFPPRGAVGFGDYCCVELLTRNFLQRARIS